MPESRDRLSRQDDAIISSYSQRRITRINDGNTGRGTAIAFILEDDNEEGQAARTPFRWRDMSLAGSPRSVGRATVTPVRRIAPLSRQENLSPVVGSGHGRGRGGGGVLPTWYPRRPLNDITAVVRAMERRRGRGDGEGLQNETPLRIYQQEQDHVHLDHKIAVISPKLTFSNKRCPPSIGKVPKILLDITNHRREDAGCLTPQKKLLNCIDTVEKVVMEELRKLKRTPSAKKAEREKRVRTLMSIR